MKILVLSLLFLLTSSETLMAQNFNIRTRYNRPSAFSAQLIVKDSCFYSVGTSTNNEFPFGASLKIIIYDFNGGILDSIFVSNPEIDRKFFDPNLVILNDTTFIVNGNLSNDSIAEDPYLIKLNLNKSVEWEKAYPYNETLAFFQNIGATFHNNKFYLANRIRFDGQQENMNLQIVDTSGTLLENKFIQLSDWGRVASIAVWNDQIILGGTRATGNINSINLKLNGLLVAVDTLGNKLWEWKYDDLDLTHGFGDLIIGESGNLIMASGGLKKITVNINSITFRNTYYEIFELDENLDFVWKTQFHASPVPSGFNYFHTLHKCNNNSGYLAGGSIYNPGPNQTGDVLGFLAKVSNSGDSLWTRKVLYYETEEDLDSLSKYFHTIYDIDETPDGDILIGGEAFENNFYPQQAWIAKVDEYGCHVPGCHLIDDIQEIASTNYQLQIFPNPVAYQLNIFLPNFPLKHSSQFLLYNLNGQLVRQMDAHHGQTNYILPLEGMENGQYLLSCVVDGRVVSSEQVMVLK